MIFDLTVAGATGYTGSRIARRAHERGLRPLLVGRDEKALASLADELGTGFRLWSSREALLDAVVQAPVLVNAAGPFAETARDASAAAIAAGSHYLDISGEHEAIALVASLHGVARTQGVTLVPAVGFEVCASDALLQIVTRESGPLRELHVGVAGLDAITRGSALTSVAEFGRPTRVLRAGKVVETRPGALRHAFDFGAGPGQALAVSWADLATAPYTTGPIDVTVYYQATAAFRALTATNALWGWTSNLPGVDEMQRASARMLPEPTEGRLAGNHGRVVIDALGADGRRHVARIVTPEVYEFSVTTVVDAVRRLRNGDAEPGFQTPGRLWGPDIALSHDGVRVDWLSARPRSRPFAT